MTRLDHGRILICQLLVGRVRSALHARVDSQHDVGCGAIREHRSPSRLPHCGGRDPGIEPGGADGHITAPEPTSMAEVRSAASRMSRPQWCG